MRNILRFIASPLSFSPSFFQTNIFVTDDFHACIADFGLASYTNPTGSTLTSNSNGSIRWMAPELLNPATDHILRTPASDVFAFGMTCIEVRYSTIHARASTDSTQLVTGKAPLAEVPGDWAAMNQIMGGVRPRRPQVDIMTDQLWDLIKACWSSRPEFRPNMSSIIRSLGYMIVEQVNNNRWTPRLPPHISIPPVHDDFRLDVAGAETEPASPTEWRDTDSSTCLLSMRPGYLASSFDHRLFLFDCL